LGRVAASRRGCGNSSSGILEAPATGTPSLNIGDRQLGRLRATSIIDCPIDEEAIFGALQGILDGSFQPARRPSALWPRRRLGANCRVVREIDLSGAFPKYFNDLEFRSRSIAISCSYIRLDSRVPTSGFADPLLLL